MFSITPKFVTSLATVVIVAVTGYFLYTRRLQKPSHYPPGPRARYLLSGNLSDIPSHKPWRKYREWGNLYGGLIHFRVYHKHFVVVNTEEMAHKLFQEHAKVYSDRPDIPMLDLQGWSHINASFMHYGEEWRKHRRTFHEAFRRDVVVRDYLGIQVQKVQDFINSLHADPENFKVHIRTLSGAVIMGTLYGHDVHPTNDPFVALAEKAAFTVVQAQSPTAMVVNLFPFLKHLPLSVPVFKFQRSAKKARKLLNEMCEVPYAVVRRGMRNGTGKPCILVDLIEHSVTVGKGTNAGVLDPEQEDILKRFSGSAYVAGSDTTVSVLGTFILALSLNPDVQRKAQEEIDAVLGKNNASPGYGLRLEGKLPYLEAVYRESLRWSPVTPLGMFKNTSEDSVVDGWVIPKGTWVISNLWAMSRGYEDPESFKPERFLKEDGTLNDDTVSFAFGHGLRVCPGRHLASTTLWLAMASVLSAFDVGHPKDPVGKEVDLDKIFLDGIISYPGNFEAPITARV